MKNLPGTRWKLWFGPFLLSSLIFLATLHIPGSSVNAATQTVNQSVHVTAIIPGPAPTTPAVITSPKNNTTYTVTPIVVFGTCGPGLLVQITNNAQLAGNTMCDPDGTFSMNLTLQMGQNNLSALNYDSLGQPGPVSLTVTVYVIEPDAIPPAGTTPGKSGQRPSSGDSGQQPSNPGLDTGEKSEDIIGLSFAQATAASLILLLGIGFAVSFYVIARRRKNKEKTESSVS